MSKSIEDLTIGERVIRKIWVKYSKGSLTETDRWIYYIAKEQIASQRCVESEEGSTEEKRSLKKMSRACDMHSNICPEGYREFVDTMDYFPIMGSLLQFYFNLN
jgi:hypothetical protein